MAGIRVDGGPVWRWDTGRSVLLGRAAPYAHFAAEGQDEALVVAAEEGRAEIPSQLLAAGGTILCWTSEGGRTTGSTAIAVIDRPRPTDYVYEPTEVETVESLKAWVEERISELSQTGGVELGHGLKLVDGKVTVDCAGSVESDNTLPVTSAAVYTEVGNIEALLATV